MQLEDRDSGTESDEENAELQALVEGECHRNVLPCVFSQCVDFMASVVLCTVSCSFYCVFIEHVVSGVVPLS